MFRFGLLRQVLRDLVLAVSAARDKEENRGGGKMLIPWNVAPKRDVSPQLLVRHASDELGRFFLALALAFNDLKGLVLLDQYLSAVGRPDPTDWTSHAGQWRGVAVQMHRWIGGVIHEVMVLIKNNRRTVRGKEMQALVSQLGSDSSGAWTELVDAALDTSGNASQLLLRIRNSAAFHYDAKSLVQGFMKQFIADAASAPTEANRAPQYSIGVDMDGTRFFYADAAVQQTMMALGLQHGAPEADRHLVELASKLNDALVPLIVAFIQSRSQGA